MFEVSINMIRLRTVMLLLLHNDFDNLNSLFDAIDVPFAQFSTILRCRDWSSSDGDLHVSS